ncbi:MAG: ABC transporter ATP-binding protein/permease [Lentisphaerae bacterium]|nr:ABC transporter ATP-binding protein/permease [Lentisphaerota bacterium]
MTGLSKTPDADMPVHHYTAREVFARLAPLLRPHRARCLLAAALVSAVGLAVSLAPLFPKYVIDRAIPAGSARLALIAAAAFLAVQFARMVLWYAAMRQVYHVQQRMVFELRSLAFGHLQRLCLRFHHQYPSGFLYERVFGNSINNLATFLQQIFQHLATYVVGLIFSLGFCLYLSPLLTVVVLLGAGGYAIAAKALSRRIYAKTRRASEMSMRFTQLTLDKLRGHKTIQAFAMEDRVQDEFEEQAWPLMMRWLDAILESMKLGFISEGLSYVLTAVVVAGGACLVMAGHRPLGTLVAFMGYQGTLIGMMQVLTNFYGQFASARASFDQLFTILDTPSTVLDKPGAAMPQHLAGRLEFRNVTFAYADTPVIRDLTASIPPGQVVALVGRSGSGKTTLTNLIMRFYDPASGTISLDDTNIRDLPLRAYRSHFAVVLQDPYLFNTTIAQNLQYTRPGVTDAEMVDALKKAHAWEFVSQFPDGLQHPVGEGGSQLSGGQRQRLALARCILVPSRFIILDEATSALDAESELLIQQALVPAFEGRTAIIIAHRLSTLRFAQRILVLDDGRLVEDGTFEDLLARRGLFHRLHSIATSTNAHTLKLEEAGFA